MTTPDTDTLAGLLARLRGQDPIPSRSEVADAIEALAAKDKARIERLEAALRPFADEAAMWGDLVPNDHAPLCVEMGHTDGAYYGSAAKYTVGDLRAARATLEDGE